jgi:hypothetical protein
VVGGNAETFDEAAAHRKGCVERHLLRGDRRDECLEGVRRERWAVARQAAHCSREHRISLCELDERRKVEVETQQPAHDRLDRVVERFDVDSARRGSDAHLAAVDHAVEPALEPHIRAVDAPEGEAVEGAFEVVGLRDREKAQNSPADQICRWTRCASGLKVATKRFFAAVACAFDRVASVKLAFFGGGQPPCACAASKNASR